MTLGSVRFPVHGAGPRFERFLSQGSREGGALSDFAITAVQRRQLLAGDLSPLDFDTKPYGCEEGAKYILAYSPASSVVCEDGYVIHNPRCPIWFISVTSVRRVLRKGREPIWRVRFDVTDIRATMRYLRAVGGYTGSLHQAIDELPVVPKAWLDPVAEEISDEWDEVRRARAGDGQQERSRARRQRKAA